MQEDVGRTREFSARAISFTADQTLPLGTEVRLSVDWPLPLDGICPLQLIIFGRVTNSGRKGATLKIVRHEFRTRAPRASPLRKPIRAGVQTRDSRLFDARLAASASPK